MPETAAVSVSHLPVSETARHPEKFRDRDETRIETLSLKALARRILDRDARRDSERDKMSRSPTTEQRQPRQFVSSPISSSPALDADEVAERAALIEFGADVPREWAEGFSKLNPDRPPGRCAASPMAAIR